MTADLIQVLAHLPSNLAGVRDRALLLVGYTGGLRRSELAAFTVDDLAWVPEGAVLTLRRNGASAFDIMRQTGHRSITTVSRYVRDAQIFRDAPASKLGL